MLLKLRSRVGEHTTHMEEYPYQRLAEKIPGGLPPNLRLVYGNMGEVLDRTDLLVTVSSTAALESLHRRIPTAILTDLGVREPLGNHHFLGSGCLASWDQLDGGYRPKADAVWADRQGVAADGSYASAFDHARATCGEAARRSWRRARCPPSAPYYTTTTAPGYLPGLLARYHLSTRGRPAGVPRRRRRRQHRRTPRVPRGGTRRGPRRVPARRTARGARHPPHGRAVTGPTAGLTAAPTSAPIAVLAAGIPHVPPSERLLTEAKECTT